MEKYLNRQQAQAILDTRPDGVDIPQALQALGNQGFTIEGYNDKPIQNAVQNVGGVAKSFVGGVGEGVAGIALEGIQKGGEALVNRFGTEQMKQNVAQAPTIREQYRTQFGAEQNPMAYGLGEMTGQVASLAAPVGAVGTVVGKTAQALGTSKNLSKIAQAGAEGALFTKGMELQSGEKATPSDYYVNTALNVAFPVAGIVGRGLAENVAPRIVNSLIKPLAKDFAYEKNPGKAVAELGITANSWEELIGKITSEKERIGQSIGQVINKSQNLRQIDLFQTLKPLDEAIMEASKNPRTNATLISRLEDVKADLVDNIEGGVDPQSFKGLVGKLTKWTGNATDDQLVNKALKQVYGSTRSAMDDILSKELTPEQFSGYKKASEQYGNLMSAENAAIYRDKIVERQDLISFGAKNAGILTGLGTAIATGGAAVPSILAGLAGAGIEKALATPAFKTRLASLLSKLAPKDVQTFFDKVPTAKSLFNDAQIEDMIGGTVKEIKANPLRGSVTPSEFLPKKKVVNSLEQEAKKYKSAEEFVKAQGTPVYHGTNAKFDVFDETKFKNGWLGKGAYFTSNKTLAKENGKILKEATLNIKNPFIIKGNSPSDVLLEIKNKFPEVNEFNISEVLKKNGYDSIKFNHWDKGEMTTVFSPNQIKTKSQLTDIWKKANKK